MSFPPNLGITSAFLIDSRSPILFQELTFDSLIPSLERVHSQFSRSKANAYSRMGKSSSMRSKSLDFADLSTPTRAPTIPQNTNFRQKSHRRYATFDSIPEHDSPDENEETFNLILSRTHLISSAPYKKMTEKQSKTSQTTAKESLLIKRSSSMPSEYHQIQHKFYSTTEMDQHAAKPISKKLGIKKKGKFLKACKRLLGL